MATKKRRDPKCKVTECESRATMGCKPYLCRDHVHEWEMFSAGWDSKSGHNWWAPDGQNLDPDGKVWDDFDKKMAAFLQYKQEIHRSLLLFQEWLQETKRIEPVAVH